MDTEEEVKGRLTLSMVDGVGRLDLEGNGLARKSLDKYFQRHGDREWDGGSTDIVQTSPILLQEVQITRAR